MVFIGGEENHLLVGSEASLPGDADAMATDGSPNNADEDGWGVIERAVADAGSALVECGSNGACFFNSVVYLLGHENSRHRVTLELASRGPAKEVSRWQVFGIFLNLCVCVCGGGGVLS
jgi:hypothetical protein